MPVSNIHDEPAPVPPARIRILVVEDSPVIRDFLTHILNLVADLQVVGERAGNGL